MYKHTYIRYYMYWCLPLVYFNQWRRNQFESGGTDPALCAGKYLFLVVPLYFFGSESTISRFGERFRRLSWWSIQFGHFLVCCSSTHGTPVPISHL